MSGTPHAPGFVPEAVLQAVRDAGLALGVTALPIGREGVAQWEWHPVDDQRSGASRAPEMHLWVGSSAPFGARGSARCAHGFRAAFFAALGELRRDAEAHTARTRDAAVERVFQAADGLARKVIALWPAEVWCDGCRGPAVSACVCSRCAREEPDEKFHVCASETCRPEVDAKHRRVRGRPAVWPPGDAA